MVSPRHFNLDFLVDFTLVRFTKCKFPLLLNDRVYNSYQTKNHNWGRRKNSFDRFKLLPSKILSTIQSVSLHITNIFVSGLMTYCPTLPGKTNDPRGISEGMYVYPMYPSVKDYYDRSKVFGLSISRLLDDTWIPLDYLTTHYVSGFFTIYYFFNTLFTVILNFNSNPN